MTRSFWKFDLTTDFYYFQGVISGFFAHVASALWPQGDQPYYPFLSKLAAAGRPLDALVATVVGLAVGSSVNYAQGERVRPSPAMVEN